MVGSVVGSVVEGTVDAMGKDNVGAGGLGGGGGRGGGGICAVDKTGADDGARGVGVGYAEEGGYAGYA